MSSPVGHLVDGQPEREKTSLFRRDKHVPKSQGAREIVRKQTFTRWINFYLKKCDPSMQVEDLYTDIPDGKILMALLEELSGSKLLYRFRPSTHHIFTLSNISKVLDFLEDRNVRVVNIDAADIADGRPSVILSLIWNIIVYFQLKEMTAKLEKHISSSVTSLTSLADSSDSACSSPVPPVDDHFSTLPSKKKRAPKTPKNYRSKAVSTLLSWVQTCTTPYGVEVCDFGKSWRSGLAFLALVKCARPELVDMRAAVTSNPRENITEAFRKAQHSLGIPPLLNPEDVMMLSPDEQSIITYVAQFLQHFPENRDVYASTLHLKEYNLFGDFSISAQSCPSLDLIGDLQDFSGIRQTNLSSKLDIFSYSCSSLTAACNGSLSKVEKSSSLNRQLLHNCSLAQKQSLLIGMKKDDGDLCNGLEEGICTLPELDSEEEDAYSYILELDHEEQRLQNHQGNGESQQLCSSHQSLAEVCREQPEEHAPEAKVLYTNNAAVYQNHSTIVTVPPPDPQTSKMKNCLNLNKFHEHEFSLFKTDQNEESGIEPSVSKRDLNRDYSSSNGSLDSVRSSHSVDNELLAVVRSSTDHPLTKTDKHEMNIQISNTVKSKDSPQPKHFTNQAKITLAAKEPERIFTSITTKKKSLHDPHETEILHTVLLLWFLTYCIFMLRQSEIWLFL